MADIAPAEQKMVDDHILYDSKESHGAAGCGLKCCSCMCCHWCDEVELNKKTLKRETGCCCKKMKTFDVDDFADAQLRRPCYRSCCGDVGTIIIHSIKGEEKEIRFGFVPNSEDVFMRIAHHITSNNNQMSRGASTMELRSRAFTSEHEEPFYTSDNDGCCFRLMRGCCYINDVRAKMTNQFVFIGREDWRCGRTSDVIDLDHIDANGVEMSKNCFSCCCSGCGKISIKTTGHDITMKEAGEEVIVVTFVKNVEDVYDKLATLAASGDVRNLNDLGSTPVVPIAAGVV